MSPRRIATLAAAAVGALALAGCGAVETILPGSIEQHLRGVAHGLGLTAKSAQCPSGEPVKKGQRFTCTLTLTDGETVPIAIVQTDAKGHYSNRPLDEIATYVQNTVNRQLAGLGYPSRSSCTRHVLLIVGRTLTCSITTTHGRHLRVVATITSAFGDFRLSPLKQP